MKKILNGLVAAAAVSGGIGILGMNPIYAHAETTLTTTPGALTTTPGGVIVTDSDIPTSVKNSYAEYFSSNTNINNISDIITSLEDKLDGINIKSNPDFKILKNCETEYSILKDIQDNYSSTLSNDKFRDVKFEVTNYEGFKELSEEGGYLYHSFRNTQDAYPEMNDKLINFLSSYDYTNTTKDKFKQDIENSLSKSFNKDIKISYKEDLETLFVNPRTDSTGYVFVYAKVMDQDQDFNVIDFSYETVLPKVNSTTVSTGGSSGSSHHSGGSASIKTDSSSNSNSDQDSTSTGTNAATSSNFSVVTEGEKKILKDDAGKVLTGWQKDANGQWLLANEKGEVQTGWQKDSNGNWYLLKNDGVMATGWQQDVGGKWYYLNKTYGNMSTGWLQDVSGKWYYLQNDGSMAHDTYVNGYYVGGDGAWVK
ncbi:hypothetical protein [Clostridium saccharoperbutylacetonicum]|uniref:hypothetical protein n=1 Tax=Clostridium saccharoperbutylacetonicum TaxID=36745 RepID=UPI0039EC1B39